MHCDAILQTVMKRTEQQLADSSRILQVSGTSLGMAPGSPAWHGCWQHGKFTEMLPEQAASTVQLHQHS
jgi:hypothetical protein